MSYSGNGTYTLPGGSIQADGTQIDAADVNTPLQDIETALNAVILRNGAAAFTANQSMGGYKLTNHANGTAASDSANLGQVQSSIVQHAASVGGTADAITATFSPVFSAYTANMKIRWTSGGANTVTAPTINVDSLGAKTIKQGAGAALAAGNIGGAGAIHEAVYDGTDFILLNPIASASAGFGQKTIWVPAVAMVARTTNGAASGSAETSSNKVMIRTLDFDATTQEFAQFAIQMPKGWDEGTLIAQFVWSHAATTTNFGVVWAIEAVAFANDDTLDAAFGTAVTATDTGGTTNDLYISPETSAMTVAGSPGAEEYVVFQVKRVPSDGSDTMAIDARLHGVKIHYTDNATDD
jgi:hypothetical protein